MAMKNVTVTMEESVAEWARLEAARRNTSVSRLIGELLAEKMRRTDRYERAMREALKFRPLQLQMLACLVNSALSGSRFCQLTNQEDGRFLKIAVDLSEMAR